MSRKRWLSITGILAGLALSLVLVGGTVFAATATPSTDSSSDNPMQTFLNRLAQNLGISSDKLQSALTKTEKQTVDDAVASGKLTQEQGDRLNQRIDSGQTIFGLGPGRARWAFGLGFEIGQSHLGMRMTADDLAAAIGITTDELQSEQSAGKTLSQIIDEHGKSVADVVGTLTKQVKEDLDAQVKSGKITQEQADTALQRLTERLTDAINNNALGPGDCAGPPQLNPDTTSPATPATPSVSG